MLYVFKNKNGMVMKVTDIGAILQSLLVPDKNGELKDVVLGYDKPEDYAISNPPFFGAIVGRIANRIGNAKFSLNGKTYFLDKNDGGNNLHSGLDYYYSRKWNVEKITENSITMSLQCADGDQGYPGAFYVEVTYTLTDENEICLEYKGIPQEDTIVNMTNHSYFNLNGHAAGDVLNHEVWINSDAFTPTDAEMIPTGEIRQVESTPMDFRTKKAIGRDIEEEYEALQYAGGYDHNWCLNNHGEFMHVASLSSKDSGIVMEVYTDLPGIQMYTGNFISEEKGKEGVVYQKRQGVCFETQMYPDAINHKEFPTPIVKQGDVYQTKTTYKFKF